MLSRRKEKRKYMKERRVWVVVIGLIISQVVSGQEIELNEGGYAVDTIPFNLTSHNNIAIKAIINEVDTVSLMFHTAANDVSLISEPTKTINSVSWGEKIGGVKSWGGNGSQRTSKNNTLKIGAFQWDSLLIWESQHSGPTTDGKFGPNLFANKFIELNYDLSVMVIHNSIPPEIEDYEKLRIQLENGNMFMEAKSKIGKREILNRYLIHSGYSGTILFDDAFAEANNLSDQIDITEEQELKDSLGNVLKTKKGKLPSFWVGAEELENMPVGFFSGGIGKQKISVVGGGLLKKFNIIFDSARENIYVKPNRLNEPSFENG